VNKVGSTEAGQHWTEVAENWNSRDGLRENPRERFNKLLNEFKASKNPFRRGSLRDIC